MSIPVFATLRAVLESDGIRWPRPALNLPHSPAHAFNGLSRHILARKLPAVFHDPLTAPGSTAGRAYRDPPKPSGITRGESMRSR